MIICLTSLAIAALLSCRGVVDEPTKAFKFDFDRYKGKTLLQTVATKTSQEIKIMGQDVQQVEDYTRVIAWTPKEMIGKDWVLAQKIVSTKFTVSINGQRTSFDSDHPDGGALAKFMKAYMDAELRFVIGPDFKVRRIEGRADAIARLQAAFPDYAFLTDMYLARDVLTQVAEQFIMPVGNRPVRPGDKWQFSTSVCLNSFGCFGTTRRVRFEQLTADRMAVATSSDSLKLVPPNVVAGHNSVFTVIAASFDSASGTGEVHFDLQRGRVATMSSSLKLNGKFTVEIAGATTDVHLKESQNTTSTVTEAKANLASRERPETTGEPWPRCVPVIPEKYWTRHCWIGANRALVRVCPSHPCRPRFLFGGHFRRSR